MADVGSSRKKVASKFPEPSYGLLRIVTEMSKASDGLAGGVPPDGHEEVGRPPIKSTTFIPLITFPKTA